MSTHANRVKMTVTSVASSGTGDITLNAASTGFRSFATAYGANATVDILITEGTAWEIARNCTYTHSGTTVNRGTLENSSTGSAVAFTSAAVVSVIATAAFGNNAALNHVAASPTTAGVTGVVGTMHLLDISGLTATRNFTLPATAAVGDRVGVYLTTGDASYELVIIGDTGDTINGGAANTEWSRLFISNECVILRCVTANSAWVVEYDGRIPCVCVMTLSADQAGFSNGVAAKVNVDTVVTDTTGSAMGNTTNYRIDVKRGGNYAVSVQLAPVTTNTTYHARAYKSTALASLIAYKNIPGEVIMPVTAGQYLELYAYMATAGGTVYGNGATDSCLISAKELF